MNYGTDLVHTITAILKLSLHCAHHATYKMNQGTYEPFPKRPGNMCQRLDITSYIRLFLVTIGHLATGMRAQRLTSRTTFRISGHVMLTARGSCRPHPCTRYRTLRPLALLDSGVESGFKPRTSWLRSHRTSGRSCRPMVSRYVEGAWHEIPRK